MGKSVTVNFDDGTSHTYDNVPDDVSDDQVTQRASSEFSGKTISGVGAGTPGPSELETANQNLASAKQNLANAQQAGMDLPLAAGASAVNAAVQHPTLAGAAAAAAFPEVAHKIPGVGQLMDVAKNAVGIAKDYNLNQANHQAVQYMKAGQTPPPEFTDRLNRLYQQSAGPVAPTTQAPTQAPTSSPVKPSSMAPTAAPSEPPQMSAARNIVQKLALGKILQAAGPALAIGQGLMYTSPEEKAVLKADEQKRIAEGGQPKKRIEWLANLSK